MQVPLLFQQIENGIVHSRFTNGFNIQMGESLIFIGNKINGLLPFGIHLREEDTNRAVNFMNNGDRVTWNKNTGCIHFPNVSISLEKGQSFSNELINLKNSNIFNCSFERFRLYLKNVKEQSGLDVSVSDLVENLSLTDGQQYFDVTRYVVILIEAAKTSDELLMDKAFRYFLGRGKGLTPSGDDLIVGLLAFDAVSHFLSTRFYEKISHLIEGESITTDVSREYLRYALKRQYSSTVSNMVNALATGNASDVDRNFQSLLKVGHSSGLDTLLGIFIGMLIYQETKNKTELYG